MKTVYIPSNKHSPNEINHANFNDRDSEVNIFRLKKKILLLSNSAAKVYFLFFFQFFYRRYYKKIIKKTIVE